MVRYAKKFSPAVERESKPQTIRCIRAARHTAAVMNRNHPNALLVITSGRPPESRPFAESTEHRSG